VAAANAKARIRRSFRQMLMRSRISSGSFRGAEQQGLEHCVWANCGCGPKPDRSRAGAVIRGIHRKTCMRC